MVLFHFLAALLNRLLSLWVQLECNINNEMDSFWFAIQLCFLREGHPYIVAKNIICGRSVGTCGGDSCLVSECLETVSVSYTHLDVYKRQNL